MIKNNYFLFSSHFWVSLSSLYGKFLVLLMLAFCLTEVMDNNIRPLLFQERGLFMFTIFRCPRFELTLLKSRDRRVSRNLGQSLLGISVNL